MRPAKSGILVLATTAGLLCARTAHASDVAAAAAAFRRAQAADLGGDHRQAAELYEVANGIAPSPEALRAALRARRSAGDTEMAATHAESLASLYANDEESTTLAKTTLGELASTLLRLEVSCKPGHCIAVVDGSASSAESRRVHVFYVKPGIHAVQASFGGSTTAPRQVDGAAGQRRALEFVAPPVKRPARGPRPTPEQGDAPDAAPAGGLAPIWFFAGAGATLVLAGATTWSGLDTLAARDDYDRERTEAGYQDGLSRERRTNVLIGATAFVGVGSAVLGLFFTDWSHGAKSRAGVQAGVLRSHQGTFVSIRGGL